MVDSVQVRGIPELVRAFKAVDSELPKELRKRFKAVADHVVGVAQQRMPFVSGTAARSLKPRATQKGAGIAFPGGGPGSATDKAAYYPWLDFGGTTGRGHSIKRGRIKEGRYLYPAIGESKRYIGDATDDAIEETVKDARFTTTGHI